MYKTWYHTLFLIQWVILNRVQPKANGTTDNHKALTILYLTDSPLTKITEESFETFLRGVSNGTNAKSDVKLESVLLPNNSASLLPTLQVLNSSLSGEDARVIILDVDEDKVKAVSLLSWFGLMFDIRTRPVGKDGKTFPNTLTVKPSLTRLQEAVERIFGEIGWTTMAQIECYSREARDIEKMKQQLKTIKGSKFTFIFAKCLDNLDLVLKHGKTIGLTSSGYRWVFPGILSLENILAHLPNNVIAVDLPGSLSRYDLTATKEEDLFLKDVLSVLEKIVTENSQKLCIDWSPKTLVSFLRRCVNERKFSGYTGDVILDAEGRRSGEIYKIFELITLNGKHRWLPIGYLEGDNVNILFNQWRLENNQRLKEKKTLRVVTLFSPPWVTYASGQPSPTKGSCAIGRVCRRYTNETQSEVSGKEYHDHCCTGLAIELLERLETEVGFLGEVHLVKDGAYGSADRKTQRWNGMIGELIRKEADLAVSSLTITAKRSKVVDFTHPFVEAANGILVSTESASHTIWEFAFLDTFSVPLWVALFLAVQVVIVTLWLAEKIRQRRRFITDPFKRDNSMSYADIINYTWSLLFQKASEEIGPSTLSGRTVAASFAFATIIACSSFTANLAAIKVSDRSGISISGIHDSKFQNSNRDFKFGTLANSANLDFFRDSNDEALQRIFRQIQKNVVSTGKDGAEKVAKGEWTAYIDDIPELDYLVSKQTDCKLKIVGNPFFFSGYGIALQQNSTWNARLSLAITKLVRDGFIQELESKWMPFACGNSVTPNTDKMGINDIGGAFLIVAFGSVICGLLLGVEYAIWRVMVGRARSINKTAGGDASQALSMLTKVFTVWDANSSAQSAAPAGATLRNFKTLTQQRHLGGFC